MEAEGRKRVVKLVGIHQLEHEVKILPVWTWAVWTAVWLNKMFSYPQYLTVAILFFHVICSLRSGERRYLHGCHESGGDKVILPPCS